MYYILDNPELILISYLLLINLLALGLFVLDKNRARTRSWRIPERILLFIAFLGGALASLVAMNLLHHKTRKLKFKLGLPILLVANLLSLIFVMKYLF